MIHSKEIWVDVAGYEGLYEVSDLGRVRSKGGNILFPGIRKGYLIVGLYKNGTTTTFSIHRIACTAFHPNPEKKESVNHINLVRWDNRAVNLEWATSKENTDHATGLGSTNFYGRNTPIVQIKDGLVVGKYDSVSEAGKAGFNRGHISRCINGKLKTHGGYNWRRAS